MQGEPAPATCVAAVRGAVAVASNTRDEILDATARLLTTLMRSNGLEPGRIVSAVFTATEDLDADFPAHAARRLGWTDVPLLGAREITVPGAMPRVIRVLLTVWGVPVGTRLRPAYLDGAAALRPDLSGSDEGARDPGAKPAPPTESAKRVALIGLGQIGGSIGLGLGDRAGWLRIGFDRDPRVLAEAQRVGAIDRAADSIESACAGAELAVLAIPVDALPASIERAAAALPAGAALVDTGSARGGVTAALEAAERRGVRAAGAHPLAGTEGHGLGSARSDLFDGATFIVMPVAEPLPGIVTTLVRDLGAREARLAPDEHDRAVARTSHLPYLLACALRSIGEEAARRGCGGPGFRDMTRLAASDPRVALAYCRANAREIAEAWKELRDSLETRITALGSES